MEGNWVKLAASDVYVVFPLGIFDKDLELLFRTEEAVDSAISQLQQIKKSMKAKGEKVCLLESESDLQ